MGKKMKRKQFIGFLIMVFCLLILLVLMFIGWYFLYESQKDKSNSFDAVNAPIYNINEPYETKDIGSSSKKEAQINENLLPDIYLEGFYPEKLNDGYGNVVMTATIKNIGDVEAHNVEWTIIGTSDYSMNVDDSDDYLLNKINTDLNNPSVDVSYSNPIESVKPDIDYKINYKFNPNECPVTVGFFLDPENKIKEKDETNNLKSVEIKGCDEEYTNEDNDLLQKKMKKIVYEYKK